MDEFTQLQIEENKDFIDFKGTTAKLAVRKFLRLNRINPGPWNNAQNILDAGRDLINDAEYTKFLEWLGNPTGSKLKNPVENTTKKFTDKCDYEDGLIKYSVHKEISGDVMTIHVKNDDWPVPDEIPELESDDEKVAD